jgi:hypothetical protein
VKFTGWRMFCWLGKAGEISTNLKRLEGVMLARVRRTKK